MKNEEEERNSLTRQYPFSNKYDDRLKHITGPKTACTSLKYLVTLGKPLTNTQYKTPTPKYPKVDNLKYG